MCVLPGHHPRRLLLGLATISVMAFQSPAQSNEREPAGVLQEIVVTATRREEPLQRTAATVQVLSGAQLESRGAAQFSDYLYDIPNVGYRDAGDGSKQISIRGISNAYGSRYGVATSVATVGMYYNDVPIQGTSRAPDLDLFDIERVEVLKGPQGTLFGEGAMGGAVRVIPVEPKLGVSESKIGSLVSSTEGGGLSYRFRGARNVPLSERVALRVVGDYGQDAGYIDNVAVRPVQDGYNSSTHTSARADLLMQPSEALRLNVFALLDSRSQDGYSRVSSGAGRFSNHDPVDEDSSDRFELVALTAKFSTALGELSSISSYYRRQWNLTQNYSAAALSVNATIGTFAANPNLPLAVPYLVDQQQSSFAQELRLVSGGDSRFDYVAGLFYRERDQDTDSTAYQPNLARIVNPLLAGVGLPLNVTDDIFSRNPGEHWEQLAAYGEASFELSSRLTATAGLRVFREESTFSDELIHLPFLSFLDTRGTTDTEHDGVLPKGTIQYQLDDERMVYVTAAKGFRSGGPNLNFVAGTTPPDFSSDSLWNYEVGL
jgi:iron complex outermembrane receptor protein